MAVAGQKGEAPMKRTKCTSKARQGARRKSRECTVSPKVVLMDVHASECEVLVCDEAGEILLELRVPTTREELRRVIGGIPGVKRVVFEHGPLAALIKDALRDLVEEIVAADPTQNPLIARAENASDELDARRLGVIDRARKIHPVYVPDEPYRELRSLLCHDRDMADQITATKNRLKGLLRRHGIRCRGKGVYRKAGRKEIAAQLPDAHWRWQLGSQWRLLDWLRKERVAAHRQIRLICKKLPVVAKLKKIPGIGVLVAPTIVAWIVNPSRFQRMNQISAYGGLGLGQNVTCWKTIGRARASKRGQRELKRVLFIAARAATLGDNALARRYQVRISSRWEDKDAIRDVARHILFIASAIMRTGKDYDDGLVNVPPAPGAA
jgi:transposase